MTGVIEGRGKTRHKGIHQQRPSVEELKGRPGSVNSTTRRSTRSMLKLQIPTITEDLTATTDAGTRPTPRPQHSAS
eukprot:6468622-Amphidinium_carterae.1